MSFAQAAKIGPVWPLVTTPVREPVLKSSLAALKQ
jgi:hypothetical protein